MWDPFPNPCVICLKWISSSHPEYFVHFLFKPCVLWISPFKNPLPLEDCFRYSVWEIWPRHHGNNVLFSAVIDEGSGIGIHVYVCEALRYTCIRYVVRFSQWGVATFIYAPAGKFQMGVLWTHESSCRRSFIRSLKVCRSSDFSSLNKSITPQAFRFSKNRREGSPIRNGIFSTLKDSSLKCFYRLWFYSYFRILSELTGLLDSWTLDQNSGSARSAHSSLTFVVVVYLHFTSCVYHFGLILW